MDWGSLVREAPNYGFLGGIVCIAGVILGAAFTILYAFTGRFADWKPSKGSPMEGLDRLIGILCAVWIIGAWLFATLDNVVIYMKIASWLVGTAAVDFFVYVFLKAMYGRFKKPTVDENNRPGKEEVIWGGLWLTKEARKAVRKGDTIQGFYAGKLYAKDLVWPPESQAIVAVLTAAVLMVFVSTGASGLSTIATAAQVVLTKKPAREILSSSAVPGLPPLKEAPQLKNP